MRQREVSAPENTAFGFDIKQAFANQVEYCRANGAPITARVVAAIARILDIGSPEAGQSEFIRRIAAWQGNPLADALPLRAAAGLHALHLGHDAPDLAPVYADATGVDDDIIISAVTRRFDAGLLPWLDGPPQTNESGRSANFIAAMLWLAEQGCPAPFDILEIGSSAGINLMMDRYHYDLGGVHIGPHPAAIDLHPEWRGPPPPRHPIRFASLRGCDIAPVDLADEAQAARVRAYIWPDHPHRFARLEAAIGAARANPPRLYAASAADFIEAELARPQAEGTTRALVHSIVWQYIPADQQQRVTKAMQQAGRAATPASPLAWIRVESNRTVHNHELTVCHWPQAPEPKLLARSHAHGAWIEWQG